MTENYTREHVRDNYHTGMPIETSTDGNSIVVPVSNVMNQFSLGLKLVGITSDGGTNMSRCTAILEINVDNKGVFDLGKPMFVMECLYHVLSNSCKAVVTGVQYDDVRVDTEVTTRKHLVHPNVSPTLSFSGLYQKLFIYCRNRTNSQ